jgi:hypothetical protein
MTKSYGAQIFCRVCHAEPFPDDPATTRETLPRVGGDWFCERHRQPKESTLGIAADQDEEEDARQRQRGYGVRC